MSQVGAGPAGLILALTLRQNGVSVRIIDKEPEYRPGQRGAGLQPRSLEVFNYLGVLQDIMALARPWVPRRVYKLPGGTQPLKTVHLAPPQSPTPSVPFPNGVHLGQYNTEAILRSHLGKLGCYVELGTELRSFEQYPDRVLAHLAKRHQDREEMETVVCHWLVGTDGARGVVRKQLGLSFLGETREDQHIVVGELEVQGLDFDHWHSWGDMTTKMLMLRPTENPGSFYLLAGGDIDHAKTVADPAELRKFIRSASDRYDLIIGEIRWISEFRPNIRMVDKFGEGRVFVAGDAAHIHSPTGGQGLNSSVQDAFNLGWKIALVEKGYSAPSLLQTYTEERLPVIASMLQKTTNILDQTTRSKVGEASHDAAWTRGGALLQLGVNYRGSPIVMDMRTPFNPQEPQDVYGGGGEGRDLRAGDRAPDASELLSLSDHTAVAGISTSLFRIFKPSYHTVMLFVTDLSQVISVLDALREYPSSTVRSVAIFPKGAFAVAEVSEADYTLVDKECYASTAYGVIGERLMIVIVRPDGVVGGIVYDLDGLQQYFRRIFTAI